MVKTRSETMEEIRDMIAAMEKRRQEEKENEDKRRQEEKENEDKRRQEEKETENLRRLEDRELLVTLISKIETSKVSTEDMKKEIEETKEDMIKKIEVTRGLVEKRHDEVTRTLENIRLEVEKSQKLRVEGKPEVICSPVNGIIKPPTFDGEISWPVYRRQFEAAAQNNGWTNEQKATALILALRGKAVEILQNIPEDAQKKYETVVSALELRYGSQYLKQVYQSQLKVRIQGSNESVQEYGAEVEKMARLAWPEAPEEFLHQFTIQCFLDGLRDVDLQQTLRLGRGRYQILKDAIVAALEYEAVKNVSRHQRKVHQIRGVAEVEEGDLNTLSQVLAAQFEKYLGPIAEYLKQKRQGRPKCYFCGLIGHLQRDCRQRTRSEDSRQAPQYQRNSEN
uniref:Uncharacterized protein LOC114330302 isoform X1 n=1 Tax=Diabrotica virgifera virgifera TaxID=50390 RepID=A0A6P7FRD1_DIAVI